MCLVFYTLEISLDNLIQAADTNCVFIYARLSYFGKLGHK